MPRRCVLLIRFALLSVAAAGAAALVRPGPAAAQVATFACPRFVDVAPIADVNVPAGWNAAARTTRRWLRGAEMFEGDPAAEQRIQGRVDRARRVTEWTIPPGSQAPTLVCQYQQTDVTLARVVPYGLRRCVQTAERPDPMRRRPSEDDPSGTNTVILCR